MYKVNYKTGKCKRFMFECPEDIRKDVKFPKWVEEVEESPEKEKEEKKKNKIKSLWMVSVSICSWRRVF